VTASKRANKVVGLATPPAGKALALAAPSDSDWDGARLRTMRKNRHLSIQQLADKVGLSVGMVSQIERGLSTPSLRSIRLLANALDVPVSWFFAGSQHAEAEHIVRRAQRRQLKIGTAGAVQELLSPEAPGGIEIYEILLEPGGSSGSDLYSHGGEKAGLVIEGSLQLSIGPLTHLLQAGDSFRFPSTTPHRFANASPNQTRFVWIVNRQAQQPS
jgi:transcriptional regulator with XRE-family HTH domain